MGAGGSNLTYWDAEKSEQVTIELDLDDARHKQLAGAAMGETLTTFLTKRFQRVGPGTAAKFAGFAGLKPERRLGSMANQELVKLSESLQKFTDFLPPDPTCLAPLGAGPLEKGMLKFFEPDFAAVVQRPASAYSGFPFVVEMGVAYGGGISVKGPKVYRFANRIPLLYDEGSDVVLKVAGDMDWRRYSVGHDPPLVIVSHICSTRIPYKTVGKENVADRPEIEREIRLGMQFILRKLSSYMKKKGRSEMAQKRANLYSKYIPLIAQFCTELAGRPKEPDYSGLITGVSEEGKVEEKV
ncbi:DNA topoisomerase VI, subunit B [Cenarchaeum symbiosum A]|uniref:DNA topoisomerase VI, subunit B n=1 Tax=Cenarchaeum symbiosum (strain A) TaxID=414004 RepID=A0RVP9_CENSY|nr:DNA topoisomerase VI, subunit B [Cenarchaeum symbiosum A]